MIEKAEIMDAKSVARAIARISFEIIEHNKGAYELCVIGIMSGGVAPARRIAGKIGEIEKINVEVGFLDISHFRDDTEGAHTGEDRSSIKFSTLNKRVILVDDVIYTGRTVRAAVDALMRRGRPVCIQLAVLIDRGHRELPIRADYVGKNLPTSRQEMVRVVFDEQNGMDRVTIWG